VNKLAIEGDVLADWLSVYSKTMLSFATSSIRGVKDSCGNEHPVASLLRVSMHSRNMSGLARLDEDTHHTMKMATAHTAATITATPSRLIVAALFNIRTSQQIIPTAQEAVPTLLWPIHDSISRFEFGFDRFAVVDGLKTFGGTAGRKRVGDLVGGHHTCLLSLSFAL